MHGLFVQQGSQPIASSTAKTSSLLKHSATMQGDSPRLALEQTSNVKDKQFGIDKTVLVATIPPAMTHERLVSVETMRVIVRGDSNSDGCSLFYQWTVPECCQLPFDGSVEECGREALKHVSNALT